MEAKKITLFYVVEHACETLITFHDSFEAAREYALFCSEPSHVYTTHLKNGQLISAAEQKEVFSGFLNLLAESYPDWDGKEDKAGKARVDALRKEWEHKLSCAIANGLLPSDCIKKDA
tara:strand:- start:616 stop:969 length:354 start_codon:yes stop_codon:yes gene_type:complete